MSYPKFMFSVTLPKEAYKCTKQSLLSHYYSDLRAGQRLYDCHCPYNMPEECTEDFIRNVMTLNEIMLYTYAPIMQGVDPNVYRQLTAKITFNNAKSTITITKLKDLEQGTSAVLNYIKLVMFKDMDF